MSFGNLADKDGERARYSSIIFDLGYSGTPPKISADVARPEI